MKPLKTGFGERWRYSTGEREQTGEIKHTKETRSKKKKKKTWQQGPILYL